VITDNGFSAELRFVAILTFCTVLLFWEPQGPRSVGRRRGQASKRSPPKR